MNNTKEGDGTDMNSSSGRLASISIHRATLQGYLLVLVGFLFIVENALSVLRTGGTLTEISGIVLGLFAIGGGAVSYFDPDQFSRGTEPAPTYLYVLAGVATVAFIVSMSLAVQG